MKKCFVVGLLVAVAVAGQGVPRCSAVDPDTAKTGDKVNVTCQNADKTTFAELYLTDGKSDIKVADDGTDGGQDSVPGSDDQAGPLSSDVFDGE